MRRDGFHNDEDSRDRAEMVLEDSAIMGDFSDRLITRIREESRLEYFTILSHFIALLPGTPPQDDDILEYRWCQRVKGGSCRCERKRHYIGQSSALPLDSMRIHNFVCTKNEERNPFAERPLHIGASTRLWEKWMTLESDRWADSEIKIHPESQELESSVLSSQEASTFKVPQTPVNKKKIVLLREQLSRQGSHSREQMEMLEKQMARQEQQYSEQMDRQEQQYREQIVQQEKQYNDQIELLKELLVQR